jgi:hypothetical protein
MKKLQEYLPSGILLVGILLRVREYLANRSLWVDEADLVNNILERSFLELTRPLSYSQHAPIGFLLVEKGVSLLLGTSEYILRIFPLIAGVVSLYLFWRLVQRLFPPVYAIIALALFSFSDLLIRYSVELKQYSLETCVAILLLLLSLSGVWSVTLLCVGIAALFFSHTAILILASVGLVGCIKAIRKKSRQNVVRYLFSIAVWVGTFVLLYLRDATAAYANTSFLSEWSYVHLVPANWNDGIENIMGMYTMFRELIGGISAWGGLGLFIVGAIVLSRKRIEQAAILIMPFLLAIVASGFGKYPYVTRVFLFTTPVFIICMVNALQLTKNKIVVMSIALFLLGGSVVQAAAYTVNPRQIENIKPLLAYYQSHREQDDMLYVYYATRAAFLYYAPYYALDHTTYYIGQESRKNWLNYIIDINHVRGNKRVWFLFSHVIIVRVEGTTVTNEEEYMTHYLDKIGKQEVAIKQTGASLYMYENTR